MNVGVAKNKRSDEHKKCEARVLHAAKASHVCIAVNASCDGVTQMFKATSGPPAVS